MKKLTILTATALLLTVSIAGANNADNSLSPGKADPGGVEKPGYQGNGADNGTRTNGPAGVSG